MEDSCNGFFSCKEFYELKIASLERAVQAYIQDVSANTALARSEIEHRMHGMNEFRKSMEDILAKCVDRNEFQAEVRGVRDSFKVLEGKLRDSEIRSVGLAEYTFAHSVVEKELKEVRDFMLRMQGMATQKQMLITGILALGATVLGLVQLFLHWWK